jgi:hypothetical protein
MCNAHISTNVQYSFPNLQRTYPLMCIAHFGDVQCTLVSLEMCTAHAHVKCALHILTFDRDKAQGKDTVKSEFEVVEFIKNCLSHLYIVAIEYLVGVSDKTCLRLPFASFPCDEMVFVRSEFAVMQSSSEAQVREYTHPVGNCLEVLSEISHWSSAMWKQKIRFLWMSSIGHPHFTSGKVHPFTYNSNLTPSEKMTTPTWKSHSQPICEVLWNRVAPNKSWS